MSGEDHAAAGLLQEAGLPQSAQVSSQDGKSKLLFPEYCTNVVHVFRFGTERLYAQKEDLLHEVLELEAEKGLIASGESTKYQVRGCVF